MNRPIPCTDPAAEATYVTAVLVRPETLVEHPIAIEDVSTRPLRLALTAMAAIVQRRHELTTHSLVSELERMGLPPATATATSIDATSGPIGVPATAARRLRELAEMRRLREHAMRLVEACEAHQLEDARSMRAALGRDDEVAADVEVLDMRGIMEGTTQAFVDQGSERDRSVRLGTPTIDSLWQPYPGSLTVVGASTGVGKSSLLSAWSLSMAARGIANGVVSAEDPVEDFGSKLLGELGEVDPALMWRRKSTPDQMRKVLAAAERNLGLPVSFANVTSRKLDGVLAAMRVMARKRGARVIAVDYLQTIMPRPGSGRDVRERTDAVLAELIIEAASLGVALVLASQLRRPDGKDYSGEPHVTALKESGTIENRAQAIVLLWRDEEQSGVVHAKLAKVKRVPSGKRFDLIRHPETAALVERDGGDGWNP